MSVPVKDTQGANDGGSNDASVPITAIIIAVSAFACVVVAAIALVKRRQLQRPLASENSAAPSVGHWPTYFGSMRSQPQHFMTNPMAGQRNGTWVREKPPLSGRQGSQSQKTLADTHDEAQGSNVPVAQPVAVQQNPVDVVQQSKEHEITGADSDSVL
jgi:hypothetical protein